MSLLVGAKVNEFFGEGVAPLNGPHVIVDAKYAVLGKEGGERSPKTFAVIKWADVNDLKDVHENRYSCGFADRFTPGADEETYAKGEGDRGPEGDLLLKGREHQEKPKLSMNERYDTFPTLLRMLVEAGMPDERANGYAASISKTLVGVQVDLFPKIDKYTDDNGEEKERQPVNLPMKGSYKEAAVDKSDSKSSSPKASPKAEAKPKAEESSNDESGDETDLMKAVVELIAGKLTESEKVSGDDLSAEIKELNGDIGLKGPKLLAVINAAKGKGKLADDFAAVAAEEGIEVDGKGNYSVA